MKKKDFQITFLHDWLITGKVGVFVVWFSTLVIGVYKQTNKQKWKLFFVLQKYKTQQMKTKKLQNVYRA